MNKLELTPAESYLLLDIENKDGKTLMKYSLINLLYKNVLSSEVREETEGTVFKKVVKKTYLSKGSQFGKLNLKAHENLLCSVMADEEDEIELVEFIKKVFEQYDYNGFYELMIDAQAQSGLLNVTEERKFFNIFIRRKFIDIIVIMNFKFPPFKRRMSWNKCPDSLGITNLNCKFS